MTVKRELTSTEADVPRHIARYFRWVLQWAVEIDTTLADQVTAFAPGVLDALESEWTPRL